MKRELVIGTLVLRLARPSLEHLGSRLRVACQYRIYPVARIRYEGGGIRVPTRAFGQFFHAHLARAGEMVGLILFLSTGASEV
ncbi:MAG: hypothetical protein WD276_06490 [Actinomycetota bacterium]